MPKRRLTDKQLVRIASEFREGILDGGPSDRMCFAVSWGLGGMLKAIYGVDVEMGRGDLPHINHVWLVLLDGRVLDATADQFNEGRAEPLPPVYLGPPLDIHPAEVADAKRPEIGMTITDARATWHSISDAQRAVLATAHDEGDGRVFRAGGGSRNPMYCTTARRPAGAALTAGRVQSVRNLAARGLLDWTGGAFDPEASAVLTERARFVLKHGRPEPGQHFEGYRP